MDNPDSDLRLMKKLRVTAFTINKTSIEMLFVIDDWHMICIVFREMLKKDYRQKTEKNIYVQLQI